MPAIRRHADHSSYRFNQQAMTFLSSLSAEDLEQYSRLVREAIGIRRHFDLLRWLQGDVQRFLPHEIMIAAWGDFGLGLIHYDIVSTLPDVRTEHPNAETLVPLLCGLYRRWVELGKTPYALGTGKSGFLINNTSFECTLGDAMQDMRSSLVHGISDERGRHDCLYVTFSSKIDINSAARNAIEFLLPYVDTALRQVAHLPRQLSNDPPPPAPVEAPPNGENYGLSEREIEIMDWVRIGKTNSEIGSILDISAFTVKNHLQRIFKKLDVYNRMQAVTKFERSKTDA